MYTIKRTTEKKNRRKLSVVMLRCVSFGMRPRTCLQYRNKFFFFFIDNYIFQIRVFYDEKEKMKKKNIKFFCAILFKIYILYICKYYIE